MEIISISIFGRPTTVEILQVRAQQTAEFLRVGGCTMAVDCNSIENVDFSYLILPGMELEYELKMNLRIISVQTFSVDGDGEFIAKSPIRGGHHGERQPFKGSIIQLRRGGTPRPTV